MTLRGALTLEVDDRGGKAGDGEEEKDGGEGGQDPFHGVFLSCPDAHAIRRHSEICMKGS